MTEQTQPAFGDKQVPAVPPINAYPTQAQQPGFPAHQQPMQPNQQLQGYPQQAVYVQAPMPGYAVAGDKSTGVAYLLWFFLGLIGVHHFYLGKVGRGIGYIFTFGWLTIGLWIDLFTLPAQVRSVNAQRRVGIR